jgi:hypothetical protein
LSLGFELFSFHGFKPSFTFKQPHFYHLFCLFFRPPGYPGRALEEKL